MEEFGLGKMVMECHEENFFVRTGGTSLLDLVASQ